MEALNGNELLAQFQSGAAAQQRILDQMTVLSSQAHVKQLARPFAGDAREDARFHANAYSSMPLAAAHSEPKVRLPFSQKNDDFQQDPSQKSSADFCSFVFARLNADIDNDMMTELADSLVEGIVEKMVHKSSHFLLAVTKAILNSGKCKPAELVTAFVSEPACKECMFAPPDNIPPDHIKHIADPAAQMQAWVSLNAEMVTRCLPLQTDSTRKFWTRPHAKPVALVPTERNILFHFLKHARLNIQEHEQVELKSALVAAIPSKFRKDATYHKEMLGQSTGLKRPHESSTASVPPPKKIKDLGSYSMSDLRKDVIAIGNAVEEDKPVTATKALFKVPASDPSDPAALVDLIAKYKAALDALGFKASMAEDLYPTWVEVLKTLGVKANRGMQKELISWVSRVLASKSELLQVNH